MRAWIGTSGFAYPPWRGSFYPAKLSSRKMLASYAERFDTVEINQTFRELPSRDAIARWIAETPPLFRFTLKAPQGITHHKRLSGAGALLRKFLKVRDGLVDKAGPVLFQLPPNMKRDDVLLRRFLKSLPSNLPATFEFRHASWLDDGVFDLLRAHGLSLCWAETEDLLTPRIATARWGYARLRLPRYGPKALTAWRDAARAQSWDEVYVYFMHEDTGTGPRFGQTLQRLMRDGQG